MIRRRNDVRWLYVYIPFWRYTFTNLPFNPVKQIIIYSVLLLKIYSKKNEKKKKWEKMRMAKRGKREMS